MNPVKTMETKSLLEHPQLIETPLGALTPKLEVQPFFCSIEPCSTISERSVHLNTSYCLGTRKILLFGPFWPLIPTCFGQFTPKSIPIFPLLYGALW